MFTSRRRSAALLGLLFVGTACFRTTAPRGWLSTADAAQREAYGGWIRVETAHGAFAEGELIAVTPETLFVLSLDSLASVPISAVTLATLTAYDAQHGVLRTWTLLGSLATVSHGVLLILTLPVWITTGALSTASASKAPRIQSLDPAALRPFARFPQGIPPGLDRHAIRQKRAPPAASP